MKFGPATGKSEKPKSAAILASLHLFFRPAQIAKTKARAWTGEISPAKVKPHSYLSFVLRKDSVTQGTEVRDLCHIDGRKKWKFKN
jgi:hypothetical protein